MIDGLCYDSGEGKGETKGWVRRSGFFLFLSSTPHLRETKRGGF